VADDDKAKLYKRIVQQTPDHTLLHRMRVTGFWPAGQSLPPDPADQAAERKKLEAERERLTQTQIAVKNPEKALHDERERRWAESKKRRAQRKQQRANDRTARREAYQAIKQVTLVHAGEGVSGGLENVRSNADLLTAHGLPLMHTSVDLARLLNIALPRLRWLTFHRRGAALVHYHRYGIPKKTGGLRSISAPKPTLAKAQRWVLQHVLTPLPVEPEAHGFVTARSILTNAAPHVGKNVVLNMDVKDFFPSITFRRVKGLFKGVGYSEHVAAVLALLCTEPPRMPAELDGKKYMVALGERCLPQGACTSPAITNLLCRRLDRRLAALSAKHGFTYTRYADDLTFSGPSRAGVGKLLKSVRSILTLEGLAEHPDKTCVMGTGRRQEVTGLTVNQKLGVDRDVVRELRAILHNARKHGLASQNRDNLPNFGAYLKGRVEFVCMVEPARAPVLRAALQAALTSTGSV